MARILAGNILTARMAGDHTMSLAAVVLQRTPKTVTVQYEGRVVRRKVHLDGNGNEFIMADGAYSQAPVFRP